MKRGWAKKTDANQQDIVDDLRKLGCTVVDLSSVGQGCPDLLVGIRGFTILMEVKNERGRNKLTPQQERWIERFFSIKRAFSFLTIASISGFLLLIRLTDSEGSLARLYNSSRPSFLKSQINFHLGVR